MPKVLHTSHRPGGLPPQSRLLRTEASLASSPTADGPGALAGFIMTNHAYDLTEAGPDKLKEAVLKAWADYMEVSWNQLLRRGTLRIAPSFHIVLVPQQGSVSPEPRG